MLGIRPGAMRRLGHCAVSKCRAMFDRCTVGAGLARTLRSRITAESEILVLIHLVLDAWTVNPSRRLALNASGKKVRHLLGRINYTLVGDGA